MVNVFTAAQEPSTAELSSLVDGCVSLACSTAAFTFEHFKSEVK